MSLTFPSSSRLGLDQISLTRLSTTRWAASLFLALALASLGCQGGVEFKGTAVEPPKPAGKLVGTNWNGERFSLDQLRVEVARAEQITRVAEPATGVDRVTNIVNPLRLHLVFAAPSDHLQCMAARRKTESAITFRAGTRPHRLRSGKSFCLLMKPAIVHIWSHHQAYRRSAVQSMILRRLSVKAQP